MVTGTLMVLARTAEFFLGIAIGELSDVLTDFLLGAAVERIDGAFVAQIEVIHIRGGAVVRRWPRSPPIAVAERDERSESDELSPMAEVQTSLVAAFGSLQPIGGLHDRRAREWERLRLSVGHRDLPPQEALPRCQ